MLFTVATVLLLASATQYAPAQAEQDAPIPIRIGIILPAGEGEDVAAQLESDVAEAARQGIDMATEELGFNAELLGFELDVISLEAEGPDAAERVANELLEQDVLAVAGGYGIGVAEVIDEVTREAGVPFLNIGSPSTELRNEQCSQTMFHIEPSGGMYLDALAGWYVGAGFRDWYLVLDEGETSETLADRLERTLRERHFGARIVGRSVVGDDGASPDAALEEGSGADIMLLLARGGPQIELLGRVDALGVETAVTGFPWPETQTREFYARVVEAAPESGAGHRATAWEPTLDAYGARELNARFLQRFGEPMDAPAWAAYQAVKLPYEAVTAGGVRDASGLVDHFTSDDAVFDVWKGIGVTFRGWNGQLRQTLFLVELQVDAQSAWEQALLVGELPAIYMPRTDPVERLDQLGDLEGASACSF